jgi:predicted CopG family antitoxin
MRRPIEDSKTKTIVVSTETWTKLRDLKFDYHVDTMEKTLVRLLDERKKSNADMPSD